MTDSQIVLVGDVPYYVMCIALPEKVPDSISDYVRSKLPEDLRQEADILTPLSDRAAYQNAYAYVRAFVRSNGGHCFVLSDATGLVRVTRDGQKTYRAVRLVRVSEDAIRRMAEKRVEAAKAGK